MTITPSAITPFVRERPIRVVIQQPVLSHYRVPVFRELARRPGIDLKVVYGDERGISNAAPDGFEAEFVKLRDINVGAGVVRWHAAQYRWCNRDLADVVVLSWSTRYLSLLPGLVRARWNDLGIVLWGHGYSKSETPLRQRSRNALIRLADSLLLYNDAAAQMLVDSGVVDAGRVFVALNTLDLAPIRAIADRQRADPAALARFRYENRLDAGPVVLFVSRLYAQNRTDLLLKATPALAAQFPGISVVIIGDGPDRERLRSLAVELGVEREVRFVGAVYGEDKLAPWFLSSDVFGYPANLGLSLIHAFSYGLPVVTTDRRDLAGPEIEALVDGVNGLHFEDGNTESFRLAIASILEDPALKRRLADAARDTVTDDYSIEKMVDGMESAIRVAAVRHGKQ